MTHRRVAVVGLGHGPAVLLALLRAAGVRPVAHPHFELRTLLGADVLPALLAVGVQDRDPDPARAPGTPAGLGFGGCVLDLSRTGQAESRARSARLAGYGIFRVEVAVLPCPGAAAGAHPGDPLLVLAGPAVDVSVATPVLTAVGRVVHAGPLGSPECATTLAT